MMNILDSKNFLKTAKILFLIIIFQSSLSFASFIKLLENDFLIKLNDTICYSYISSCDSIEIFLNEKYFGSSNSIKNFDCIRLDQTGKHKIEAKCKESSIYFYVNVSNYYCDESEDRIIIEDLEIRNYTHQYIFDILKFSVKNLGCKGRVVLLETFINNELIEERRVALYPKEIKEINISLRFLKNENNNVKIKLRDDIYEKEIYVEKRYSSNFHLIFLVLTFGLLFFIFKYNLFSYSHIFVYLFVSSIVLLGYIFDRLNIYLLSNNFSIYLFALLLSFITLIIKIELRKWKIAKYNLKSIKNLIKSEETKIFLILLILILFFTIIPKFIVDHQITYWNAFYERQARETFYNGFIPRIDKLSYLGREMTYPRGYFILKSCFLWLFNLSFDKISEIILEILFNSLFIFSLFYLTKNLSIKYSLLSRFIFTLSFCSFVFIFTLMAAHLLHVPSMALLFYSLGILIDKKFSENVRVLISTITLFSSTLIHPYSIILYAVFSIFFVFVKEMKICWKIFLPLFISYIPLINLTYSSENVALAEKWGWFLKGELIGAVKEFSFPLFLTGFIVFLDFYKIVKIDKKPYKIRKRKLITEIFLILFLFVYISFSFRVNIIVSFFISFLLLEFLNEAEKNIAGIINKRFLLFLIIILANFSYSILEITSGGNLGGYVDETTLHAIKNLGSKGEFVISDEGVISDPFLGHIITFITGKKVVADLYVEYANENMLKDAIEFSIKNDFSIANRYNITKAITKNSCKDWNKIYSNIAYNICEKT